MALGGLGDAEYVRGRMISAHDRFRRCVELCARHGFGRIEVANRPMMAFTRWLTGDTRGALADADAAIEAAARVGHRRAEMIGHHAAFFCRHALMDFERRWSTPTPPWRCRGSSGPGASTPRPWSCRSELHRLAGRRAQALADARGGRKGQPRDRAGVHGSVRPRRARPGDRRSGGAPEGARGGRSAAAGGRGQPQPPSVPARRHRCLPGCRRLAGRGAVRGRIGGLHARPSLCRSATSTLPGPARWPRTAAVRWPPTGWRRNSSGFEKSASGSTSRWRCPQLKRRSRK